MMLSIVLPCYNERENLLKLFERLDLLGNDTLEFEIILVNNGSTDQSEMAFKEYLSKRDPKRFKLVHVEKNLGYGFGILSGLKAANGEVLSYTHADHQTDPADVFKAYEIYSKSELPNTLVKGFRKNRKVSEALFSYGMSLLSSLALGKRLREINAQPKVFSKAFFDLIKAQAPHDFSLDLYILYKAKSIGKVIEFPVYFEKRTAGEAKGGSGSTWKVKWKLIKRSYKYIFELRKSLRNKIQNA